MSAGASQEGMEWERREGLREVVEGKKRKGKGEERGKGGAERSGGKRENKGDSAMVVGG